ncbi:MAG: PEP-CTERM sorting domain-containing protein, partial [Gammaproteobacteria bacterium]|nr:PEP-CTERM sorting domain-containing protein [Gammaproteobacteria bacterium]
MLKKIQILIVLLFISFSAHAIPVYVGSYHVTDGPQWTDNPDVYSAIEAAEIVFGAAVGGTYSISLSADINAITNTAWYAVIGLGPDIFAEDFSQDLGPTLGYNGGGWSQGDDISAYVSDRFFGANQGTNHVFFEAHATPEPSILALLGIG